MVAIAQHEAMRDGICRAAVGTLAKKVSASRRWAGMQLEPMQSAGLIAIDQRRNGARPVIEVCWSEIQQMVKETCAPHAHVKTEDGKTCERPAQVQRSNSPTCEPDAQVEPTEPSLNPH